jgi:hypothetical protein
MELSVSGSGAYTIQFATFVSNAQPNSTLYLDLQVDGVSKAGWTFVTDGSVVARKYDLPWFSQAETCRTAYDRCEGMDKQL